MCYECSSFSLRGPAPLHHALLEGRTSLGVTLQTLDHEQFDHGLIIEQESFELPQNGMIGIDELTGFMAEKAAQVLKHCLEHHQYRSGNAREQAPLSEGQTAFAGKIEPAAARPDWSTWSTERILRTSRAMGGVWSLLQSHRKGKPEKPERFRWHDLRVWSDPPEDEHIANATPGVPVVWQTESESEKWHGVAIRTADGELLMPTHVTPQGRPKQNEPERTIRALGVITVVNPSDSQAGPENEP